MMNRDFLEDWEDDDEEIDFSQQTRTKYTDLQTGFYRLLDSLCEVESMPMDIFG